MNKFTRYLSLAVLVSLFTSQVYATDNVNIKVTGKIVASPCTTINGGSSTLNVPLGDIQATTLATAGSGSSMVAFELPLTGCPASTTKVKVTFSGTADTDATRWKNTAAAPAASTSVEISQQDTSVLVSNDTSITEDVVSGAVTYKLQARAYSKDGSAMPGDIESVIVASFEYQ